MLFMKGFLGSVVAQIPPFRAANTMVFDRYDEKQSWYGFTLLPHLSSNEGGQNQFGLVKERKMGGGAAEI
ncbi:hypothetical protein SLEP1_g25109 [Rubroshorea leprosula]|uniref:Uncharacterized protein n=1 Tax=Rubroshorea leprosula TaxID=152421 RepID=A0AAV5JTY6_9ROSI|nr:hypothetical protein SLEP1_g25109 [Rubroshorea leprosula]